MEWNRDEFTLTDDPDRIDFAELCSMLWGTYWAETRGREVIERSVRRSLSFVLLRGGRMAGFARVITDTATVGYLCDFVIAEDFRGQGIGQWMLQRILDHPDLAGCRIDLFTRDAQEFYKGFGFGPHKFTSMVRYPPRRERDGDEE
jgi:ribosomal protein S18 acetylase RimI-like enzyme